MTSPLQQLIETIAKEKGIEPSVIISAIEDAVLAASRKAYKSNENLKARFNAESGQGPVRRQTDRRVGERPGARGLAPDAQQLYGEEGSGHGDRLPKPTDVLDASPRRRPSR
jgi:N utilization substance protein A